MNHGLQQNYLVDQYIFKKSKKTVVKIPFSDKNLSK